MDRKMIAPWRAEEKEQSEKLHKKLQGLSLLYPMTEEMVKLLSWDMFLKPNQAAFFQVMHYLFRILDPVEFKRRFYWPITDKKSEANFRSTTVDYLKHLNEKHQLNWTNIKSYLVVMPGGMKFINFVLDLVGFVVKELTKQREKALSVDLDIATIRDLNVQSMSAQNSFMKEYASAYIDELKQLTARFRQCTQKIRDIFFEISKKTNVDVTLLLDDQFLEDFEAYNRKKCDQNIKQPLERIRTLEGPQGVLKDAMDRFLAKQTALKQNKESADYALRSLQKFFGTTTGTGNATGNALISALNGISDTIAEHLDANDHYSESNEFVTKDLQELRDNLQQLETQVNDVQKNLRLRIKEHNNNISGNVSQVNTLQLPVPSTPMRPVNSQPIVKDNSVLIKFVSTPPIKPEGAGAVRKVHVRLPLQDDFNAKQFEVTCNNLLAPAPLRSARKTKQQQDQFTELDNTLNRSKIFDPMQLLRTINKKSKPVAQPNLSNLGSKWKQLHASFGFDESTLTVPTSPKPNAAIAESPFTPLNCNEHTRIERIPQAQVGDTSNNSYAKSAAVLKVLDASLNVQNLSTSPSGRLDALVPGPSIEGKVIPRIQLNDQILNDSQQLQSKCKEIDVNQFIELPAKFDLNIEEYGDNDDLLNVSDSVLKDIPF
ncbi:augmin complex subunit dgt6 [Drosophila innubila]|uniref:augmin complex subunit dgt6 n=1 Tax=Drosophila innubila TaxID=198719 RepID=UPI00148BCFA9|nr:augmin complex subunit dgt6 [Drosophila innubila]